VEGAREEVRHNRAVIEAYLGTEHRAGPAQQPKVSGARPEPA
jgi:hypothetical protein